MSLLRFCIGRGVRARVHPTKEEEPDDREHDDDGEDDPEDRPDACAFAFDVGIVALVYIDVSVVGHRFLPFSIHP